MRWIGVDLHTNSFTACFLRADGCFETATYAMNRRGDFLRRLRQEDQLAVESTGNSRWFVAAVKKAVGRVVVVDPNKFEVIKKSTVKTDENDAYTLSLFLSKDIIPEARVKSGIEAELSSLVATRSTLVGQRTALINTVHNLLNAQGVKQKKERLTTKKGIEAVVQQAQKLHFPASVVLQLTVLSAQIVGLHQAIKKLDDEMIEKGKTLEGHRNLASIKGIGDKASSILLSVIGNVKDFADENKLAAYFGMVPTVRKSNETVHYGRITKKGSKIGRTTMVQCALVAKRYSPYLAKFHERIKQRRGSAKANIATARKLLTIVYQTLTNRWIFTDFARFEYTTS